MNQGWNLGEWRMAIFQGLKKSEELYMKWLLHINLGHMCNGMPILNCQFFPFFSL